MNYQVEKLFGLENKGSGVCLVLYVWIHFIFVIEYDAG